MSRVDTLIGAMTLAEKLGQLTMTASSYAVTGPIIAGDSTDAIKAGTIGNLLNMVGAAHAREMQRLAVEESRLGIPLLIGFDVIHGHRTLFPIPLGEAALFDPRMWALTARESAREAAAEAPASPLPTTKISNFRLLFGLTSLDSLRCFRHFDSSGPDGTLELRVVSIALFEDAYQNGDRNRDIARED